jgi:hypothetical protein
MKSGELMGVRDLAPHVADRVLPRMIVPPRGERDDQLQARLSVGNPSPSISNALSRHWPDRDVLVEATYLYDEFGRDRMQVWLPRMFEEARTARARPIPLVTVNDLLRNDIAAYRAVVDHRSTLKFGVVFSSDDLDDDLLAQVMRAFDRLGIHAEECVAIADFQDSDFTKPDVVAPIIAGVLDTLQYSAPWQQIVFQGTSYPQRNPAEPGGHALVPRNEWISWRKAVRFDPATAEHMIFGDYAADCAKMAFKRGGAAAIRHYRYATSTAWRVQRGVDTGSNAAIMRTVCQALSKSPDFAGRNFSSADDYIFRTANEGGGPGGAGQWRAVNTTHHITRVVADISTIRGLDFRQPALEPAARQIPLFPEPG